MLFLLILLLILVFFILFVLIVILFFVVFSATALILLILFLLTLTQGQIVACLVVVGIVAKALFIGFDGLGIHLMFLANPSHIVERHRLATLVGFEFSSVFKLHDGRRVFLLHHHRAAEVVNRLRIALIGRQRLLIFHFGLVVFLLPIEFVALSDMLSVGLCVGRRDE